MADSISVFAEHALDYEGQRRRVVPSFDLFYGTAVELLTLRPGAVSRMEMDRCADVPTQLAWMGEAGLEDCECFFKHLHFAVLAGWRGGEASVG